MSLWEDWMVYERDITRPGLWVMIVYRFGRWRYTLRSPLLRKPLSLLYKLLFLWVRLATGIELPCETRIGRRLCIWHHGGIVVHDQATFGDDVILRQGVTVGVRGTGSHGCPRIGDRVDIGAGAKILGAISLGNDVVVGANAVVLTDVPDNCLAVGVPARVLPRRSLP